MAAPKDCELLQDIASGNALALRTLYGRMSSRVYNTALSYVQNAADAEEITQDVFTKIWRSAGSFKAASQVTTWVYRITVNTSLTALKKRERRGLFSALSAREKEVPDFHHPNAVMEDREANRVLFSAIYRLPHRQKTAFVLSYVEELPRQQVAEIMNLSLKAVESLLMRAKKGLREGLTPDYPHRGNVTAK